MNNISKNIAKVLEDVRQFKAAEFGGMAGKEAMAFINTNFRNQSWEGQPWKKRRGGKRNNGRGLLMDRGTLRRGNNYRAGDGSVTIYNNVRYAAAHNNGFYGTINIAAHSRKLSRKAKVSSVATRRSSTKRVAVGSTTVKAHTRTMRLPRRQFMPTKERQSPTLNRMVYRKANLRILKILKRWSH